MTVKVPAAWPGPIVMLGGTFADADELVSVTSTPFVPAGVASVTVPVDGEPPVTRFGES